ncbi:hypothetical protein [Prevotella koreensis]|uniref:Uncharacterized protein n=1 Tax=Prevotella koreensis TaxID=2490854 RepID=A0A432LJT0_9BACT|nr:hypothetical protein [Prevotella koreensis]RUL59108.1 hypothetical protein EHV08_04565 [Prevotella koreensis]
MIAKINLDGKERMAIVFDETFTFEYISKFRQAINSYMQTTEAHLDSKGCDYTLHEDNYYLHVLMNEMDFTENQIFSKLNLYYNGKHDNGKPEKKLCEIYI